MYKKVIPVKAWASNDGNLALSFIEFCNASVIPKPSKQNTAIPPANGNPPMLDVKAVLCPNEILPITACCTSSFNTIPIAKTLHILARMLKGAKADKLPIHDNPISIGTKRNIHDVNESAWFWNTDERFCPMNTKYAIAPPHCPIKMRISVRYRPNCPKLLKPKSPYVFASANDPSDSNFSLHSICIGGNQIKPLTQEIFGFVKAENTKVKKTRIVIK